MKTNRSICLVHAALALALWPIAGHAENAKAAVTVLPPSNAGVIITVTPAEPPATVQFAAVHSTTPRVQWNDIKDCTSEMRNQFFTGLQHLEAMVYDQINELTVKRAVVGDTAGVAAIDQAIKEMRTAQFFLKITGDTLTRATPRTWDQQKAKVGLAWGESQEAYRKIKPRTII